MREICPPGMSVEDCDESVGETGGVAWSLEGFGLENLLQRFLEVFKLSLEDMVSDGLSTVKTVYIQWFCGRQIDYPIVYVRRAVIGQLGGSCVGLRVACPLFRWGFWLSEKALEVQVFILAFQANSVLVLVLKKLIISFQMWN